MAWFRREHTPLARADQESRVPEGLWVKCGSCKEILYRKDVVKNLSVCPKCGFHFRISARERLEMLFDGPFEEFDDDLVSRRSPEVRGHEALRGAAQGRQGQDQRLRRGDLRRGARSAAWPPWSAAMEYAFIGGSMGVVVGEKVTRAAERALAEAPAPDRGLLLRAARA